MPHRRRIAGQQRDRLLDGAPVGRGQGVVFLHGLLREPDGLCSCVCPVIVDEPLWGSSPIRAKTYASVLCAMLTCRHSMCPLSR